MKISALLLTALLAQAVVSPIDPPAANFNALYIREVAVLGNLTPTKLTFQRVERPMPICDLPVKTFLWWTWPDTSKVCLAVWVVDIATNENLTTAAVSLNGVTLVQPAGSTYYLEKIDRGQPMVVAGVVPAGYNAAGKTIGLVRMADGSGSYLAIWELTK